MQKMAKPFSCKLREPGNLGNPEKQESKLRLAPKIILFGGCMAHFTTTFKNKMVWLCAELLATEICHQQNVNAFN